MRMRSSTGAATRAVRSDIEKKPAERAANASHRPSAAGLARETNRARERADESRAPIGRGNGGARKARHRQNAGAPGS
jgi:hypothetical protein